MASESIPGYLRIRLIKRKDAGDTEITSDLAHLHQTRITMTGMQPGNPASSAVGSFSVKLHPPGTDGYAANKAIYDQITRYQRLEFYVSPDGASLGKLLPGAGGTGIITGIRKTYDSSPSYELTGVSDVGLANMSRPFPGEFLSNDVSSAILKSFLGTNELGASDTFNPFTAANYTATATPSQSGGTWTGTTDDSFNVVTDSTGTGAALISKTGASSNDRWFSQYVQVTGRLKPSSDTSNAGQFGVGFSTSTADCQNSTVAYVYAAKAGTRYILNASIISYSGNSVFSNTQIPNVLFNVDDPQGMIPLTVGLLIATSGNSGNTGTATLTVNGKAVIQQFAVSNVGTRTQYPFIHFGIGTGSGPVGYFTNLVQMTRFTTDGPSTAAAFGNGTITTSTRSLAWGVDPGPTFAEIWTRLATREGWYWRYTPQAYTVGTRTLGTVDFAADPGTDLTKSVIFSRAAGNLIGLQFNNNADPLAGDTAISGQSTLDGGGIGLWQDIGTLSKYGVIQDEALSFTHSDFNTLRRASYQISANKIALDSLGAKTAMVLRDPDTADKFRELDKITIHDPEMGINYLAVRVMARTFVEGDAFETLMLDQFAEEFTPGFPPY